jgi:hypothetical protein
MKMYLVSHCSGEGNGLIVRIGVFGTIGRKVRLEQRNPNALPYAQPVATRAFEKIAVTF